MSGARYRDRNRQVPGGLIVERLCYCGVPATCKRVIAQQTVHTCARCAARIDLNTPGSLSQMKRVTA